MDVRELNRLAAPIFEALVEAFCDGPRGQGIYPSRLAFTLSISEEMEKPFLRALEKLLRVEQAFGNEPPVILLASRWVSPKFDAPGLDQTEWNLFFDLNPRAKVVDPVVVDAQIAGWLDALDPQGSFPADA